MRTRAPDGFEVATLTPDAARWEPSLAEYVLDSDDVCASPDPHAAALDFARWTSAHACAACDGSALAASAEGTPPPVV